MRKRIIVTGGAGFIGSNLCDFLLQDGHKVVCIDNFDEYYDPNIKRNNIKNALTHTSYTLIEEDIKNTSNIAKQLYGKYDAIIHLAAKAGVRYSLKHPVGYEESNVVGTKKILDLAVQNNIKQFIFASSSSIYGNSEAPFKEDNQDLMPISPYAQTKLFSEKTGKEYADSGEVRFISLRFFSVYGPRLRPDLVMNKIAASIYQNKELNIFGDGKASRDYTYVDDIIQGIIKSLDYKESNYEIFNLGNGNPIELNEIIKIFEEQTKEKVNIRYVNSIKGESNITWADIKKAKELLSFNPKINIETGIQHFLNWHK